MNVKKATTVFFRSVSIPFQLALAGILAHCIWELPKTFSDMHLVWMFVWGGCGGSLLFSAICRFSLFYVFGHEMTHLLVAKLFLRKTGKIHLGLYSGSVEIQDSNVWITLAPYILPFYLIVAAGIAGLVIAFGAPLSPLTQSAMAVLLGMALAYHIVLTLYALTREQPDLKQCGYVFSLTLILTGNILLLFLAMLIATGQWHAGLHLFVDDILAVWHACHQFFS